MNTSYEDLLKRVSELEKNVEELRTLFLGSSTSGPLKPKKNPEEEIIKKLEKKRIKGATKRDLKRDSRILRDLSDDLLEAALKKLVANGRIELKEFESTSGRGRKRIAYVLGGRND